MSAERLKGRHGLHNLLTDAYGGEIPESDFGPVVVLLDRTPCTQRAMADLMDRFTTYPWDECYQRILQIVGGGEHVSSDEMDRVEQKLALHGYRDLPDLLEEPSTLAVHDEGTRLPEDDGPDRLHRIHAMLAGAYPIEVPLSDYVALIQVLRRLHLSVLGILNLLGRFHPRGTLPSRDEVEAILGENRRVADHDVARVEARLTSHGLAELASVADPRWVRTKNEPDPEDPRVPVDLKKYWRAMVRDAPRVSSRPKTTRPWSSRCETPG